MFKGGKANKAARKPGDGAALMQQVCTIDFFVSDFLYILFVI
jgi:hypothetical protein